jgi:hypothetical protein
MECTPASPGDGSSLLVTVDSHNRVLVRQQRQLGQVQQMLIPPSTQPLTAAKEAEEVAAAEASQQ